MKKALLLLFITMAPLWAAAQAHLVIDTATIVITPPHPIKGDTMKLFADVKNIGNAKFSGYLRLLAKIKISRKTTDTGGWVMDTTLTPGNNVKLSIEHIVVVDSFRSGTNIIVVWPTGMLTGGGTVNGDSAMKIIAVSPNAIFLPVHGNNSQIRIFPNPSGNELCFYAPDPQLRLCKISVMDIGGATVLKEDIKDNKADVSSLPGGLYFISVTTSVGKTFQLKVIKMK